MPEVDSMSFASSYVLASKVRSKLTKEAASPKSSLRSLVLQANMLDNIMDHITAKTEQMKQEKRVSFSTPLEHDKHSALHISGPSVTEYEIDSDSDSDSDFDSDSDSDAEHIVYMSGEDEDEYYFSSDSDQEDDDHIGDVTYASRHTMPVIDLSDDHQLSVIYEENEESLPDLTHSVSSSDSESEDDIHIPNYILSSAHSNNSTDSLLGTSKDIKENALHFPNHSHGHHQRQDAIYSMETMF